MHDITRPLRAGMAVYPNNPPVTFEPYYAAAGQSAVTRLTLGSHTGTHIDAPAHIAPGGQGSATYSLEQLCGPCEVIDLSTLPEIIEAVDLPSTNTPRVLIKTKNSSAPADTFDPNFVALADSAAAELVKRRVTLVGIDGPSIKKKGARDQVHQLLLEAGVVIIEGLWLADIQPGAYELFCLPLAVDLDGAPARVVLRR